MQSVSGDADAPIVVEPAQTRTTKPSVTSSGLPLTRYVEVRRQFLRELPGHALDSWQLPADYFLREREFTTP
jgi:hypothetical protein